VLRQGEESESRIEPRKAKTPGLLELEQIRADAPNWLGDLRDGFVTSRESVAGSSGDSLVPNCGNSVTWAHPNGAGLT